MRLLLFLLSAALSLPGAIIVEYNGANTGTDSVFLGQSITTPAGGPWANLAFHLFDANGDPSANGTLYLLSQEYLGAPNALSTGTPGYLASTSTVQSGIWSFDPGISLSSNTQYFFYTDSLNNILRANTTGTYPDGIAYMSLTAGGSFAADASSDTLFNLSGTASNGVPEPSTALTIAVALGLLALVPARKRTR